MGWNGIENDVDDEEMADIWVGMHSTVTVSLGVGALSLSFSNAAFARGKEKTP